MRFPLQSIRSLIPDELPPLDDRDTDILEQRYIIEDLAYRSWGWTRVLTRRFAELIAGERNQTFSVGFLPVPDRLFSDMPTVNKLGSFVFGAHVVTKGESGSPRMELINVNGLIFPLIRHYGTVELHNVPRPSSGASTCWIRSNSPKNSWTHGILTCRHNVNALSIGSSLNLTTTATYNKPSKASIGDMDECTIDGAVLEIAPTDYPVKVMGLPITTPVYPGLSIRLNALSGTYAGTVLRTLQLPNYFGNLVGHRVIIDCHGIPGDSGSLVERTLCNEGVGIYMGQIPDGRGGYEGLCQCLKQVREIFGFDCYT